MTAGTDTNPGMQRRNIYVGVGLIFALLLAIYFVTQIREVVLAFLLALLFSIIISGPVNYLTRKGIGRGFGVLIVLGSLALVFVLAALALAPTVGNQARQLAETLPTLLSDAQGLVEQA
nr:AI-2E family transporter [Rubrobacter sp.]